MPVGYTPPAGSAVNLNFTGAYTPPAGSAVILNFFNSYVLTADPGTYAIAGTPAGLIVARRLAVAPGSYSITGAAAQLIVRRLLQAAPGTYAVAGSAAALSAGRRLFAYDQLIPGLAAGGFTFTDLSGWTVTGLVSFTLSNGSAVLVDASGGSGVAYRSIAVNPGQQYTLQGYLIDTTAAMGMAVGTTAGGQQLGSVLSFAPGTGSPNKSITFTAPVSGVVYVSMFLGTSGQGNAGYLRMEQAGRYQLVGTDATLTKAGRVLSAAPGTYAVVGSPASLKIGRRLSADPGVYTQVRTSARLLVGRRLQADAGTYAINVHDADISFITGFFLHAERGSYSIVGSPARLLYGRKLVATPGTYSLVGTAASWVYGRFLRADPGTYALVGSAMTLRIGYRLKANPGNYTLVGTDVNLINRRLIADPGAYSLNGTAARLLAGRRLQATPGVYTVAGSNARLLYGRRLVAAPGSYALTGPDAGLKIGRRLSAAAGVYTLVGASARLLRGYTVHATPGIYAMTFAAARILTTRRMIAQAGVYRSSWPDVALVPTWAPRGPRSIAVGFAASRRVAVPPQNRRLAVEPQSRRCSVEAAPRRYAAVEPRDKELMGGSMLKWPEHDPNEVLDYDLDWADPEEPRLQPGETLLTSLWSIVEGDVVIANSSFTAQGLSKVWLTSGTPGTKCVLLNRVTTSTVPRSFDKEVSLRIRDH